MTMFIQSQNCFKIVIEAVSIRENGMAQAFNSAKQNSIFYKDKNSLR